MIDRDAVAFMIVLVLIIGTFLGYVAGYQRGHGAGWAKRANIGQAELEAMVRRAMQRRN